jgi:hypothetical protein
MLIISYKKQDEKLNIYDHKNTLYIINKKDIEINKLIGKFVEIINENIEKEIINIITKYYKKFNYILLINNNIINFSHIFDLINKLKEPWLICGNIIKEKYYNDKFIPEHFNINCLLINCNKINISEIKEQIIKDINFPIFSKIIYSNRKKCIDKNIMKINKNNLIII